MTVPANRTVHALDRRIRERRRRYTHVDRLLAAFDYHRLPRPNKTRIKSLIQRTSGFSRAQLTRLIAQHRRTGRIIDRRRPEEVDPR